MKLRSLLLAFFILFFSGCLYHQPLKEKEDEHSERCIALPSSLGEGQRDQLTKIFAQQGLSTTTDEDKAQYYFSHYHQKGSYQELYQEQVSDIYYLESLLTLEVCIKEKFSQETILERVYQQKHRLRPHEDFYSERDWYQAQVQFETEQKLYAKIAYDLNRKLAIYETS